MFKVGDLVELRDRKSPLKGVPLKIVQVINYRPGVTAVVEFAPGQTLEFSTRRKKGTQRFLQDKFKRHYPSDAEEAYIRPYRIG